MNIENTTLHREADASIIEGLHGRRRSDGVLNPRQIEMFRAQGIALAFDPLQLGWVTEECQDDLTPVQTEQSSLAFRAWSRSDAPSLAAMLSSEAVWRYLPEDYSGPIDIRAAEDLIDLTRADHHLVLAVTRYDVPIGQVRLLYAGAEAAEVSYWLGEPYWGKGYASEMVKAFCDQCLRERPDLSRLFARVHKDNTASQRVLRKAGLQPVAEEGEWLIFERAHASAYAS
jgi:RimJ/RimL family protein N-acetyltransferase